MGFLDFDAEDYARTACVKRLFFCHKLVVSFDEELEKLSHSEVDLRKKQYNDKRRRKKLKGKEQEEVRN